MVVAAAMFFISAIGSGLAFSVVDLIIWRVIGGLGVGAASVIAPAYIAEVSPAAVRGRLGSLQQLAIVTGIFAALLSDALLAGLAGAADQPLWGLTAWRWMFMVAAIPALVYGLMSLRLPESPRYLVRKGELKRAAEVLETVTGTVDVQGKIDEITGTIDTERSESLRDLRGNRLGLKPIVWIGILLSVFQQFVGINVIFYYSTTLWQSVGFDESSALLTSVITSVTNIVVTIVAILLVDKIGRRIMLLVGSVGMTVTLGLMAVAFSFGTLDAQGRRLSPTPGPPSRWSARTDSSCSSARAGARSCGFCSARSSRTRSEPAPSRWPLRRSGSRTSSSPRRSRPSRRSDSPSPTASTRSSRFCRSSSSSSRCRRPRGKSSRR